MFSLASGVTVTAWAIGLAVEDWRRRRLPNAWLLLGLGLGLGHYLVWSRLPFGSTLIDAGLGFLLALLLLIPIYARGWMGAGDVKFAAVLGGLSGLNGLFFTLLLSALMAGGLALYFRAFPGGRLPLTEAGLKAELAGRIPYGSCLAVAWITVVWCNEDWPGSHWLLG